MTALDDVLRSDLADDPHRSVREEPVRAELTAARRRNWGEQASLAALALGAVGGFLVLARAIRGKRALAIDNAIVRAAGRTRHPLSNALARGATFFGSVLGAGAVSAVALGVTRARPRLAGQIALGAVGGTIAEIVVKRWFRRARPTLLDHLERVSSSSFPSGHSMAAASIYLTLAFVASRNHRLRAHRAALLGAGGAVATTIGASRVYLGVHWPTDVLAGLALGTAWASTIEAAFDLSAADAVDATLAECGKLEPASV